MNVVALLWHMKESKQFQISDVILVVVFAPYKCSN